MSRLHELHGIRGARWEAMREAVFRRDNWRCVACGRLGPLECDHVRPLALGGAPWDPANLQSLCHDCHAEKNARERPRRGSVKFIRARAAWKRALRRAQAAAQLNSLPQGNTTHPIGGEHDQATEA